MPRVTRKRAATTAELERRVAALEERLDKLIRSNALQWARENAAMERNREKYADMRYEAMRR